MKNSLLIVKIFIHRKKKMQIERNCEIYEGKCGCETYEKILCNLRWQSKQERRIKSFERKIYCDFLILCRGRKKKVKNEIVPQVWIKIFSCYTWKENFVN